MNWHTSNQHVAVYVTLGLQMDSNIYGDTFEVVFFGGDTLIVSERFILRHICAFDSFICCAQI